ncbi:MAG: HipA family kinase [Bryobacteraceae bacterium]
MPVQAVRHIRRMRGGAQAHLVEADDGHFYVVKFLNNAQHRRVVVNELVCSMFLQFLDISIPPWEFIELAPEFVRDNPQVAVELGRNRELPAGGWHFGSRFPGDPAVVAVYDFLPDALLPGVANLAEYCGVLAFDKWVGNADARQSIFFRARLREWNRGDHPRKQGFVSLMIDHGYAFNGPHWDYVDSPLNGLYLRKQVYAAVRSLDDFQPWLDRIVHFPEDFVDRAWRRVPPAWVDGDEAALEQLLVRLLSRRKRLPNLIADMRDCRSNPFPAWT